jgi:hypothetical protein
MLTPTPPKVEAPEDRGSAVLRVGTAVGAGSLGALVSVLPAALRLGAADDVGLPKAWVALAAAALLPMVLAVLVLRGARESLRAFGGPGAGLRAYAVGVWLATMLIGLSMFGSVLRATTHHHALAGVTFAFGALFFAIGDALVCARLLTLVRGMPEWARRVTLPAIAVGLGLVLLGVGLRFVRAASTDAASYAAAGVVVDVLAFSLAAVFASRRGLEHRRFVALLGPPVAVGIAVFGLLLLRSPPMRDAISERAPAFVPVADTLSGR